MPKVGAWVPSAMGVIASLCSSVCTPLHTSQIIESLGFMGFMSVLNPKFSSSEQPSSDSSQASWELLVLAHSVQLEQSTAGMRTSLVLPVPPPSASRSPFSPRNIFWSFQLWQIPALVSLGRNHPYK